MADLRRYSEPFGWMAAVKCSGCNSEFVERRGMSQGDWLAYLSAETGRAEVFVSPFHGPGNKIPISSGGGYEPRWRGGRRELFYVALPWAK